MTGHSQGVACVKRAAPIILLKMSFKLAQILTFLKFCVMFTRLFDLALLSESGREFCLQRKRRP